MKILYLVCLSLVVLAQDGRLDPHGSREVDHRTLKIKENRACTVCHYDNLKRKESVETSCQNCHNKAPHSGVAEHLGKTHGVEKINCLSCHVPHRYGSKESDSGGFFKDDSRLMKEILEVRNHNASMLRRTCVECHKW